MTKSAMAVDANPNGIPNQKTGTMATASIHIFCGIVGAGVLALPRSLAFLGWIAGPMMIILFYLISLLTSMLLADVYEVNGVEHGRYHTAVHNIMGHWSAIGVSIFQCTNMFLVGITYTISAATSMKSVANIACGWNDISDDACFNSTWKMTLFFGAAQLFLSQVPSLEEAWWVSAIGVFTSLFYSFTALALGLKYSGAHLGTIGGIEANPANKAFGILNALGAIAFAYSFSVILLEIQDTLRQPPKAVKTMKPASFISITGSFAFYFTVAVANYSAFGNDVPSFILNAFPGPKWLVLVGFICIMLHMMSAYQVFSQPMFDTIESHIKAWNQRRALRDVEAGADSTASSAVHDKPAKDGDAPEDAPADAPEEAPSAAAPGAPPPSERLSEHGPMHNLHRVSAVVGTQLHRLSASASMYRMSTGFANEAVHSNDEHVLLPLWQRIITRSIYVCITTVIACVMPFFSDMAGLVGAVTFFPLAIYFPIRCWRVVYKPVGAFSHLLWTIEISMVFVCIAATIASLRGIINNWSSYTLFD